MSLVVTGATGQFGRLVVESLLTRGVPADQIVATGRDTTRLAELATRGVRAVAADYDDVASLEAAFAGADKLLLVSGSEIGQRARQHTNAISAAGAAGVGFVAYTSLVNADTSSLALADEHRATEAALRASGLAHALLRNGWYLENYTGQLATYLQHGVAGAAGDGRVSAATRQDLADAAAAVLTTDVADGTILELGGAAFTLTELADTISTASGTPVAYTDLDEATYRSVLVQAGLPEAYAALYADSDRGLSQGDLEVKGDDLATLIGRTPTTLAAAVATALAGAGTLA